MIEFFDNKFNKLPPYAENAKIIVVDDFTTEIEYNLVKAYANEFHTKFDRCIVFIYDDDTDTWYDLATYLRYEGH